MHRQGLICVSISAESAEAAIQLMHPVLSLVDLVELRLDAMPTVPLEDYLACIPKPILVTNRPQWEGGRFPDCEEERIAVLCQAVEAGAAYVDIELRTESGLRERLLATARAHGTKVIISSHDFADTPPWTDLCRTLQRMRESGGDMGKVVTTATTSEEALRILSLQLDALATGFPLSAFAMGEAGRITRFATLYLGGCMTYVAPDELSATAPGQMTVTQLRTLIALFEGQP